jgi:GNAT superfamily N-acetyltransferase
VGLLQRWFNLPYHQGDPYITDKRGRKFWVAWEEDEHGASLYVFYHGFPTGNVNLLWDENRDKCLILADIFTREDRRMRQKGLGKAMLQETIRWARKKGAIALWGWIQPHDGASIEYIAEWYQRQGFRVEPEENKHCIFLPL